MTRRFHGHATRILPAIALGLLAGAPLRSQTPDNNTPDGFSSPPRIEKRITAARAELVQAGPDQRDALQSLESSCQYHLAAVRLVNAAREDLAKANLALGDWKGFSVNPPFEIRFSDGIRANRAALDSFQKATEAQIRIITSELESARDQLSSHQSAARRLNDTASTASDPEELKKINSGISRENINSRISTEEIARLGLLLEAQRTEQKTILAKSQLLELQLDQLKDRVSFSQSELDSILAGLESAKQSAIGAMEDAARSSDTVNPLLAWRIEFINLQIEFWQTRYHALATASSDARKAAIASYQEWSTRVGDWMEIARLRLDNGSISSSVELDSTELRDALRQALQFQRRIGFAIDELGGRSESIATSLRERITSSLRSIWDAELYLAEEDDIIDGRKVPTYRAVTFGKIVRLALIMTVGWLLLRLISRRIHPMISRRPGVTPGAAQLITRIFFGVGITLLVIYALNAVHIPFTAFAFLGGALAIGIGFGTQTILKNFISGVILIFERPFKVGDIIEIGGITGKVRSIGMRASRIDHFDGIDTLIPNSNLLENTVTNWSFSDTLLRYSITVGVAYGSNTREVARILLAVAGEHGLVLDKPEPEIRFSDFGDNSLIFNLLFWYDSQTTRRDPLASDLRFMIEKALAEAGIVISFPQRDLHFDPATPLRVELTRSPKTTPAKP